MAGNGRSSNTAADPSIVAISSEVSAFAQLRPGRVVRRPTAGSVTIPAPDPIGLRPLSTDALHPPNHEKRGPIAPGVVARRYGKSEQKVPSVVAEQLKTQIEILHLHPDNNSVELDSVNSLGDSSHRLPGIARRARRLSVTKSRLTRPAASPPPLSPVAEASPAVSAVSGSEGKDIPVLTLPPAPIPHADSPGSLDARASFGSADAFESSASRDDSAGTSQEHNVAPAPTQSTKEQFFLETVPKLLEILKGIAEEAKSREAAEGATLLQAWLEKTLEEAKTTAAAPGSLRSSPVTTGEAKYEAPRAAGYDTSPIGVTAASSIPPGSHQVGAGKDAEVRSPAAATAAEAGAACGCGQSTCCGTCYERVSGCTKAVWEAFASCWHYRIPVNLYCCKFSPKVSDVVVQAISIAYGIVYAVVSNSKAVLAVGEGAAPFFSIFSFLANYAQIRITLGHLYEDFAKNFKNLQSWIGYLVEKISCGVVSRSAVEESYIATIILLLAVATPVAGLAVLTAAPLASATLSATGMTWASYAMWALRSILVLKSAIGLPDMVITQLKNLWERWREVDNGDKSFARALVETGVLGLAAYIAVEYSLTQEGSMGEYCVQEFAPLFNTLGIDIEGQEALFSKLGLGPLLALNFVFIVGGGETALDLFDRFHPLLLLTLVLAGPTGFPGIALINDPEVMAKVNAYASAFLSNWRALSQLPYVDGKLKKDRAIQALNELRTLLGDIRGLYDSKYAAERAKGDGERNEELLNSYAKRSEYCHAIHDVIVAYSRKLAEAEHPVEHAVEALTAADGRVYSAVKGVATAAASVVQGAGTGLYNVATTWPAPEMQEQHREDSPLLVPMRS